MRIGVRTDAVMRFEKTISPLLSLTSLSLILDVLKQYSLMLGEYTIAGMSSIMNDQVRSAATSSQYIPFDLAQCVKIIWGDSEDRGEMVKGILGLLGFGIEKGGITLGSSQGLDAEMNSA